MRFAAAASVESDRRRSLRLKGYDYAQAGAYFVTICTQGRECLFGEIIASEMLLNAVGEIVLATWNGLSSHYPHIATDEFVVMPNHVHGIVFIERRDPAVGAGLKPTPTRHGLGEIVRAFKTFSARRVNVLRGSSGRPLWQRDYHDHIVRGEESLNRIRQYIRDNPAQWQFDRENPARVEPRAHPGGLTGSGVGTGTGSGPGTGTGSGSGSGSGSGPG